MNTTRYSYKAILLFLFTALICFSATVSIDMNTKFQTIDGFGTFGAKVPMFESQNQSACYSKAFSDLYLKDIGATLVRLEVTPQDQLNIGWGGGLPSTVYNGWVKQLNEDAKAIGVKLQILLTVWSAPGNLKTNGSFQNGGYVDAAHAGAYADYLNGILTQWENFGIDVLGISLQNEPSLSTFYQSGQYTPNQYVAMLKIVGPKIKAAHPKVRVTGPEDLLWVSRWPTGDNSGNSYNQSIEDAIMRDATAKSSLQMWATHSYNDASANEGYFSNFYTKYVVPTGYPFWQTEVCFFGDGWSSSSGKGEALDWAKQNWAALEKGHCSANFFWKWADDGKGEGMTVGGGEGKNNKYYAAKHYWKFIRPGAVNVKSTASGILATSFVNTNNTITIVLLNTGASTTVTLSGTDLPTSFDAYTSTSSSKWQQSSVGQNVTTPGNSLVTLVGQLAPRSPVKNVPFRKSMMQNSEMKIYNLQGRVSSVRAREFSNTHNAIPAGVYCVVNDKSATIQNVLPNVQ